MVRVVVMVVDLTGCYISATGRDVVLQVAGRDRSLYTFPKNTCAL